MSSEVQLRLKQAAEQIGKAARDSRAWVREAKASAPTVSVEADSLLKEARKVEGLSRKLSAAATRRMCVGVFGASQKGKSYLVSVLARPQGKSELFAKLGDKNVDFVTQINPVGERESTGLVTRFTVAPQGGPAEPGHPVDLTLLSELDLVKIFGNTFQSDFDQNNVKMPVPRGDDVRALLSEIATKPQNDGAAAHLDEISLTELSEYFYKNFCNRWQELENVHYWERLIELAPRLALASRVRLFSVIWGGLAELSALFGDLTGHLERLGFPSEVVTEERALIPRENSIIDVQLLKIHLGTPESFEDLVKVKVRRDGGFGASGELPRTVLAALVAELRITMSERPWPLFDHTDLLDFPGARTRSNLVNLPTDSQERALVIRELFVRGKVAYLFQRYSEERELTALLLCMAPGPNDVPDLGPLVRYWIELTHGVTPEARSKVLNALYLVLTKMDLEFLPKAGDTEAGIAGKWDTRLFSSLIEAYQRDGWPENFNGKPFDNTLLLRNPNMRQDQVVSYRMLPGTKEPITPYIEEGLSETHRSYIDKLERAFMNSAVVDKHVANRRQVWDAMFKLNDGGVSHIIERLTAVSDPSLKNRQVEERLRDGVKGLQDGLGRFHHSSDSKEATAAEAALLALRMSLLRAFQPRQFRPFARFIATFTLGTRDIREVVLDAASFRPDVEQPKVAAVADDDIFSMGTQDYEVLASTVHRIDRADHFAQELHGRWVSHLRLLPQDEDLLRHFALTRRNVSDIVDQLVIGSARLDVVTKMADRVRQATSGALKWEDVTDRITVVAENVLNGYVSRLGFDEVPLEQRPTFPEKGDKIERRIFQSPALPATEGALPVLGDKAAPMETNYFIDWGIAFVKLGISNFGFEGGRTLSPELNLSLGKLIAQLAVAPHSEAVVEK